MRVLKENLLIQFSIASSVVIITLAMVLAYVFTVKLNNDIDLLQQHGAAMMSGTMIKDAEPFSIPNLTRNAANLQWITYSSLAGGFAFLYGALFLIVWRGWKIIRTQRSNLQSLNAQLNERVTESVEQLEKANEELRVEVQEHRRAEHALRDSNLSLEEAYTELRETQQQITHQERMRAMGQMASGVAHDFNNALGPIVAYTDLLLEVPEAQDNKEEMTGYLQAMRTSAKDATNMVKRLQGFYRPLDSSEIAQAVDVNQLIENSISLTQPRWRDQALAVGITIDIATDLKEVPLVSANPADVREVLTNLIINAADAMPHGGTITFSTRSEGQEVNLEVSDTGTGMTEEVRQRCMDPFFSTKGERGSGLGLSMVYGIIQRGQGTIDVDSELGNGTRFTIRLPLRADAQTESKPSESSEPLPSLHILVVDDDPRGLLALTQLLRALGHSVDTATNGREGLEKFRAGKYDLLMTDRAMPNMNGDQLAAAVKELDPDGQVIMMTGFGDIMAGTGERPPGLDLVLSKPITLASLREALLQLRP